MKRLAVLCLCAAALLVLSGLVSAQVADTASPVDEATSLQERADDTRRNAVDDSEADATLAQAPDPHDEQRPMKRLSKSRRPSYPPPAATAAPPYDMRMLPLMAGIALFWAWVVAGARSRSVSPQWGMLFRPRATVRAAIAVWRPKTVVALLLASSLAIDVIDPERHALGEKGGPLLVVVVLLALAAATAAVTWIYAAAIGWMARRLGGRGSTRDTVTATALAHVPVVALLPLTLLALALYGADVALPSDGWSPGTLLWLLAIVPMALWAAMLWFPAFAAAQGFSLARSVGVSFVASLVAVVLVLLAMTALGRLGLVT